MNFHLEMSSESEAQFHSIMDDLSKKGLQKQIRKALRFLQENPRHPSLHSHLIGEAGGFKVWTSYVQNHTPQAYRILWTYGKSKNTIYILKIIPHY